MLADSTYGVQGGPGDVLSRLAGLLAGGARCGAVERGPHRDLVTLRHENCQDRQSRQRAGAVYRCAWARSRLAVDHAGLKASVNTVAQQLPKQRSVACFCGTECLHGGLHAKAYSK